MLRVARDAVVTVVTRGELPEIIPDQGIFAEKRGVFVTLFVGGKLHGCIGVIDARESLGEGITQCAVSAATQDPRFPAMKPSDLDSLELEISLLSPLFPIRPEEVEVGKHGLVVAQGARRGLLLPQVATEHHLSRDEFLQETSQKAGLPRNGWREPGAKIFGFTAIVFGTKGNAATESDQAS